MKGRKIKVGTRVFSQRSAMTQEFDIETYFKVLANPYLKAVFW